MSELIEASAPSNIALIKYMGKSARAANLPANASLSLTLPGLRTYVRLQAAAGPSDDWAAMPGHAEIALSEKGRQKFLAHFARLKEAWKIEGAFSIRSANNFPSDCGLASSASSFAALTQATYLLAERRKGTVLDAGQLSCWSRLGSGSSCRSFFSPWALWRGEGAEPVSGLPDLLHAVILVEDAPKAVSSSEAHLRVASSPNWAGRPERAEGRLADLMDALRGGNWPRAFKLCWDEFEDMHNLFETSEPAFSYRTPQSRAVTERLRRIWEDEGDGPLVTMDAGPNVHILFRPTQVDLAKRWLEGLRVWEEAKA